MLFDGIGPAANADSSADHRENVPKTFELWRAKT